MKARSLYAAVAIAAVAAGSGLWWAARAPSPEAAGTPAISPGALFAAAFRDPEGRTHSLGELSGKILVVNFWATWCAPCREEMPAFARLQERWAGRGVQFVGLANDDPAKVARFGREVAVNYPLWVGEGASELSRRLGNRLGVLPHTVILRPDGTVAASRVGPYTEATLDTKIREISKNP